MGVGARIILILLCVSLGALTISAVFAFASMDELGSYAVESSRSLGMQAVEDSSSALQDAAEESLIQLAVDQAAISNQIFDQVRAEIDTMAIYAGETMVDPAPAPVAGRAGGGEADPVTVVAPGAAPSPAERAALAAMDRIFVPVYRADPRITLVYTGSSSGLVRLYPGSQPPEGYDPRTRSWFTDAVAADGVVWSAPYIDALGHGMMITCARAVTDPAGDRVWVVAADVTLQTIDQQIINTQVGTTGYAFLIDGEGNVISGPGMTAGDLRYDVPVEGQNLSESPLRQLRETAGKMVAGETGISLVELRDGARFIAYAPVESTGWSVGIVLPQSEVIAPAVRTQEKIAAASEESILHIAGEMDQARFIFAGVFALLAVAVVIVSRPITRLITDPLDRLKEGADAIGQGDLGYRVQVTSGDEFESLAHSFNTMAGDLRSYMEELRRTTAEAERIGRELEIAHQIQESFLPDRPPRLPGLDIAGRNIPALEVGGDFYDFIELTGKKQGLVIADVSGKGVPAALFMALSRTLIRASAENRTDPRVAIELANRLISRDARTSMFVTAFYAIVDPGARELTYVNAGHNPPLLVRGASGSTEWLQADGIALGVLEEMVFESVQVALSPGDLVVMYTDGVTEAQNEANEEFGEDRLVEMVTRSRSLDAESVLDAIITAITDHAGTHPQHDDITLLVLKVGGPDQDA
ncbi:MAG: SpoIIE family protein phosphatase [Methanomicrobiales archaeon]